MIKKFEEYSEKLWSVVSMPHYLDMLRKKDEDNYDKVFNLANDYFDLYEYSGDDNDIELRGNITNEYKFKYKNSSKIQLVIFLKKDKTDIEITTLNDDWYAIRIGKYEDYTSEDYYETKYFTCDGFDGLKQWFEFHYGKLNESVNHNQSYEEITLDEYREYYRGGTKFENIKEKELSIVQNLLVELDSKDVAIIEMYPIVDELRNCINIYNGNVKKSQRSRIDNRTVNIDKLQDEWYLLVIEDAWPIYDMRDKAYKCDQIDGLLNCLKNIYGELNKRLEL